MKSLLEEFLAQEATPHVRKLIFDAVTERGSKEATRLFEFNRFELTLDFDERTAVIEDVLDTDTTGSLRLGLDEFLSCLRRGD